MARKNRVTVPDGIYHVTARVAHRAMLLMDERVKDRICGWIRDVARFSGVEVYSYCVMDNHLHLLVHHTAQQLHAAVVRGVLHAAHVLEDLLGDDVLRLDGLVEAER